MTWRWAIRGWVILAVGLLIAAFLVGGCSQGQGGLVYTGPTELTVEAGKFVPGTPIQFVGATAKGAEVRIEGEPAFKQLGDSLIWQGEVVPGVRLSVNLRILHISEARLVTGGVVTVEVQAAQPQAGPARTDRPVRYTLPVTYKVDKGKTIPGTTVRYVGTEEGKGARLEGLEGYPYRAIGDSILWEGHLTPSVDVQQTLRVLFFNDRFLQVLGTATLYIAPSR